MTQRLDNGESVGGPCCAVLPSGDLMVAGGGILWPTPREC